MRPQVTFVDDCLTAVAVAEARPPPDEYKTDSADDFSDWEGEDIAPVTVSSSGRPIRAHFRLDYAYSRYVSCFTGENIFCLLLSSQRTCLGKCNIP